MEKVSKLVSRWLLWMQLSMHMTKLLNAKLQCHLNQAATCHLKPQFDVSESTQFRIQVLTWAWPRNALKCFNKFHSSNLLTVVLKSWNIQAGSASWTDRLSHKDSVSRFEVFGRRRAAVNTWSLFPQRRLILFSFNAYSVPQPLFINAIVLLQVQHDQPK